MLCFSNKKFCVSEISTGVYESASNKILSDVSEPVYDCFVAKPAVVKSVTFDSEPADLVFNISKPTPSDTACISLPAQSKTISVYCDPELTPETVLIAEPGPILSLHPGLFQGPTCPPSHSSFLLISQVIG